MAREHDEGTGYLGGLITGVLLGAAAALLLAPKSGKELRQDLTDNAETFKGKASEVSGTVAETVAHTTEDLKHKGEELLSHALHKNTETNEPAAPYSEDAASALLPGDSADKDKDHDVIESV